MVNTLILKYAIAFFGIVIVIMFCLGPLVSHEFLSARYHLYLIYMVSSVLIAIIFYKNLQRVPTADECSLFFAYICLIYFLTFIVFVLLSFLFLGVVESGEDIKELFVDSNFYNISLNLVLHELIRVVFGAFLPFIITNIIIKKVSKS